MKKTFAAALLVFALLLTIFPRPVSAAEGRIVVRETGDCIYGVPERTTLSRFAGAYFRPVFIIKKPDGGIVDNDVMFLGTGFSLSYESEPGGHKTLTLVVLGDLDGNGRVTSGDYLNIKAHLNGSAPLSGAKLKAADIDGDRNISTLDYALVKSHFLGEYDICENQVIPPESSASEPIATSDPWTSGWA